MTADLLPLLRGFAPFATVPDAQLQWLAERMTYEELPAQHTVYSPGDEVNHLIILLEGRTRLEGGASSLADPIVFESPALMGVLPYSRMRETRTFWRTDGPVRQLRLHRDYLKPLTCECYELTEICVHQMTARVRDFTTLTQQTDKMAALGRMSAGLAHELNNPVAAVVRTATLFQEHLRATPDRFKDVMNLKATPTQTDAVSQVIFRRLGSPAPPLSMMQRSRREDDLLDWLDDHQVTNGSDLTDALAEFGFTPEDLDEIDTAVGGVGTPAVVNWVANNLITEKLVRDIADASERIAALIGAMKSYTHMDRGAGKTTVVLRDGLQSTLTLLAHKLKTKAIEVDLRLPDNLPTVDGWPGELNQVWTNLLDNAIDALPERGGRLEIVAEPDREFVVTRLIDNGTGIPPEILSRIFEPFYTTKPVGQGTGLGLDIVQGIVRRHHGAIKVQSEPGRTEFLVCLPASAGG